MPILLKGAPVVAAMNEGSAARCAALQARGVTPPQLAIVRVGERPDDLSYERGVRKRCAAVGVAVWQYVLPTDAGQEELLAVIGRVNRDSAVHGCLLFRPCPRPWTTGRCAPSSPRRRTWTALPT